MKNLIIPTLIAISTIMFNSIKLDAQTEKMTPEILWDLGRVSLDHINNNLVIYGVTNYDLKKNKGNRELYLADLNTGAHTQLTNSPENDYSSFLIKGGNSYVFIKKGQLYISNTNQIKSEKAKKLTSFKTKIQSAKITELNDGRILIVFSTRVKIDETPLERHPDKPKADFSIHDDLMYRHWDSWTDYSYNHIGFSIIDPNNKTPTSKYIDIMKGERFHSPLPPFGGS